MSLPFLETKQHFENFIRQLNVYMLIDIFSSEIDYGVLLAEDGEMWIGDVHSSQAAQHAGDRQFVLMYELGFSLEGALNTMLGALPTKAREKIAPPEHLDFESVMEIANLIADIIGSPKLKDLLIDEIMDDDGLAQILDNLEFKIMTSN